MSHTGFNGEYRSLMSRIWDEGDRETNARTGTRVLHLPGGHSFRLDLGRCRLPVAGNRRYYPHVAAAETAWELLGTKDPTYILQTAPKIWQDFVEDGEIKCAYGYRWRWHFGRDQIRMALCALSDDPTNRQVFVSAWDPATDGLGAPNQPKNVPCPVGFSLTRAADVLHMSVFIRSSDVFVGLPYDVMGYALKLDAFAADLGCRPGSLHVTLAHAHIYEPHWNDTKKSLRDGDWVDDEPPLPAWTPQEVVDNPWRYLSLVRRQASRHEQNRWDPKPIVVV